MASVGEGALWARGGGGLGHGLGVDRGWSRRGQDQQRLPTMGPCRLDRHVAMNGAANFAGIAPGHRTRCALFPHLYVHTSTLARMCADHGAPGRPHRPNARGRRSCVQRPVCEMGHVGWVGRRVGDGACGMGWTACVGWDGTNLVVPSTELKGVGREAGGREEPEELGLFEEGGFWEDGGWRVGLFDG
eukprot:357033-Chlamydomonas_euryale.AAC.1